MQNHFALCWNRLGKSSQIRGLGWQRPGQMASKGLLPVALTVQLPVIPHFIISPKKKKLKTCFILESFMITHGCMCGSAVTWRAWTLPHTANPAGTYRQTQLQQIRCKQPNGGKNHPIASSLPG